MLGIFLALILIQRNIFQLQNKSYKSNSSLELLAPIVNFYAHSTETFLFLPSKLWKFANHLTSANAERRRIYFMTERFLKW